MPKVASGQGEDFGTLQALVLLAIGTEITKTVKSKNCKKNLLLLAMSQSWFWSVVWSNWTKFGLLPLYHIGINPEGSNKGQPYYPTSYPTSRPLKKIHYVYYSKGKKLTQKRPFMWVQSHYPTVSTKLDHSTTPLAIPLDSSRKSTFTSLIELRAKN